MLVSRRGRFLGRPSWLQANGDSGATPCPHESDPVLLSTLRSATHNLWNTWRYETCLHTTPVGYRYTIPKIKIK